MIGAALPEHGFDDRRLFTELALLLVEYHKVLHARTFLALGIAVTTAKCDTPTADGAIDDSRDTSVELVQLSGREAFDQSMRQDSRMRTYFVGNIVTRAGKE